MIDAGVGLVVVGAGSVIGVVGVAGVVGVDVGVDASVTKVETP
jgi:hypothetical protein